jgi:hypothetical protein
MNVNRMKSLMRKAWYLGLLALPPMVATAVGTAAPAAACTGAAGPSCGCGCSSSCSGYHECSTVLNDEGCQTCVIGGTGCREPACT